MARLKRANAPLFDRSKRDPPEAMRLAVDPGAVSTAGAATRQTDLPSVSLDPVRATS